jgi:hypothetical protein
MKYIAKFPYTDAIGTLEPITVSDKPMESKEEEALWYYNRSREHDGLAPITVLPFGTTFTAIEEI